MSDYIDKQAAIDAVSGVFAPTPTQKDIVEDCLGIIENLPSVEVEPVKRGRWIKLNDDDSVYQCSVCKEISCCKSNYCEDCGAKMDGVEE